MKKTLITLLIAISLLQAQIPEKIESNAKSIPLGVGMSVLVPGAGQLYAENPWMAILYLTIEAAAITGTIYYNKKGADEIVAYEDFADEHWHVKDWLEVYNPAVDPSTHRSTVYVDWRSYSPEVESDYALMMADIADGFTTLEIEKDYHFYENIGKYQQFRQGWDDWVAGGESTSDPDHGIYARYSENQYSYAALRRHANYILDIGKYFGTAIFLNHFISAIDAGFRLKKHNENQDILFTLHMAPLVRQEGAVGIQTGINVTF